MFSFTLNQRRHTGHQGAEAHSDEKRRDQSIIENGQMRQKYQIRSRTIDGHAEKHEQKRQASLGIPHPSSQGPG